MTTGVVDHACRVHAGGPVGAERVRRPASRPAATERDHELMLKVQTGDRDAFRQLVDTHQRALTNFVARTVLNEADADDLTQEIFLKVYRAAGRYRPEAKFTTWLYRIAKNTCLNRLATMQRARLLSLETLGPETTTGGWPSAGRQHDPHVRFERHELAVAVDGALRRLSPRQRMAVTLRRWEGFSYREIADAMECSVEAVDALLRRAAVVLRVALAPYGDARPSATPRRHGS